jgi:nucleotide-binding universal stress UspA family protein
LRVQRILIATDGSPAATAAIVTGLEIAAEHGAEITFVHVLPPGSPVPHHVELDESEPALRGAADAAEAAGVSYALERVAGNTVDEIVAVADAKDVELIVVGSRGRSGVASLLGSVSLGVLKHAARPVMVVKDKSRSEAA